ncbi:hypothetical protein EYC84_004830 [Monilinia fructicola]|uniref:Uncharacterized protein n=1 Tax=Monilinia fructicola TaxID=38448 RepID=A0A5M9K1N9_MONFR|nr:hypothetical protein EYC84_004830 [Monilinia fructicola]
MFSGKKHRFFGSGARIHMAHLDAFEKLIDPYSIFFLFKRFYFSEAQLFLLSENSKRYHFSICNLQYHSIGITFSF